MLNMPISFFYYPADTPLPPPHPSSTHTRHKDKEVVVCRSVTHQDVGSDDIRIITDRFHKEHLARERGQ